MEPSTLGERFKQARKQLRLTRRQVAERANTSEQQIVKVEEGKSKMPRNLDRLATVVKRTPMQLLYGAIKDDYLDPDLMDLFTGISRLPKETHQHFYALLESFKRAYPVPLHRDSYDDDALID